VVTSSLNNPHLNINVKLAEFVLRNNLSREFLLFIHLKSLCDGYISITSREREYLKGKMGWTCNRSLSRNLSRLEELDWIYYSERCSAWKINGWKHLLNKYNITSSTVRQFAVRNIENVKEAKAHLFSMVVAKRANQRKWYVRKTSRAHKGHSFDLLEGESFSPLTLSVSFLAEVLDSCKSEVHRMKKLAERFCRISFISRKHDTNVSLSGLRDLKKTFPDYAHRMRCDIENDRVLIQLTDTVKHNIKFKKSRQTCTS
jgi:hypothetical protein